MSKLSKKAAKDIAAKFNSIDVSEMLQRSDEEKYKAGQMTTDEYVEASNRWNARAIRTAKELYDTYGIVPVGYAGQIVNRNAI